MTIYSSNNTVTIPGNAKNVRLVVAGGSGENGQAGYNSGSGGSGRSGTFFLPDYQQRNLTFQFGGGGSRGNGGSWSYQYLVPRTCTGTATATSSISAQFVQTGGKTANLSVTGTGSANICIRINWNDNPNDQGDALGTVSVSGAWSQGTGGESGDVTRCANFEPGNYAMSFGALNSFLSFSSNDIQFRDDGGNDTNGRVRLSSITQNPYTYSYTYDCSYFATGYYYGGYGGRGGDYAAVFDSLSGSYIIVAAGGGGGGGGNTSGQSGTSGSAGGGWSSGSPSPSSGGNGTSSVYGGGGGGGGGSSGGGGGGQRTGGSGGGSVYRSSVASLQSSTTYSGGAYIDLTFTLVFPVINIFTASKSSIINNGETTTLSWTSTDGVSATLTRLGDASINVPVSGSYVVAPTTSSQYTLVVTGPGGVTTSATLYITVYQPPVLTLSLARSSIVIGESTTLSWSTTGDASTITWTSGGITNGNLNSSVTVAPTDTTTYSATVSGLGGSDSDSVTLTVYQLPTASLAAPASLLYNQQGTLSYDSSYSNISLILYPYYTYGRGIGVVAGTPVTLPKPSSATLSGITSVSGTIATQIPYNIYGPRSVDYVLIATGSGGQKTVSTTTTIIIDETPENIIIPESEDTFKLEDPVVSPDYTVVSDLIQVADIDIPVEIKASRPIQVDVNQQGIWIDIKPL